jgi:predicted AlkP superfamily pyrophosphatase or phosphodiesterase
LDRTAAEFFEREELNIAGDKVKERLCVLSTAELSMSLIMVSMMACTSGGASTDSGGSAAEGFPAYVGFPLYKRVVILGVDGAGNFFSRTATPNMDELFAQGTVTYEAVTAIPTNSAECWGAMLLGVEADKHGLTNAIASSTAYDVNSAYPSIFRITREAMPQAALASFCNWDPINTGIIEDNLGVQKFTGDSDALICDKILTYLDENDPVLLFTQFDEVDGAGHKFGFGSRPYLAKISEIDALIGKVVAKYREKGYFEDTLFIVGTDHGGNLWRSHGGKSKRERLIFVGFTGKTVKKGVIKDIRVWDIAAITVAALGLEAPGSWTGRVPEGIFY